MVRIIYLFMKQTTVLKLLGALSIAAGVALVVTLTGDVLWGDASSWNRSYMAVQMVTCMVLAADFFARLYYAPNRRRYFARNWPILLLAIPYLNIIRWAGVHPGVDWYFALKCVPLIRVFWMIWIVVLWVGRCRRAVSLLWSYILSVVGIAYVSALIFYAYEAGNPGVDGFGNSLWWAWMSLSTAGASIVPMTTIGKVLAVFLPCVGMMLFPVFTVYYTSIVTSNRNGESATESAPAGDAAKKERKNEKKRL